MQIELTRKHSRNQTGNMINGKSLNEIHLDCTELNRGESEFLYESLMGFLNTADQRMKRYFVSHDLAELEKKNNAPERAILADLQIIATHSKRLSMQDREAINGIVTDLKKLFEELR